MLAILHLLATFAANLFRSRRRLEIENLFLRHQLNIAAKAETSRSVIGIVDGLSSRAIESEDDKQNRSGANIRWRLCGSTMLRSRFVRGSSISTST
jgi:hypothetical protein